MKNSTKPKNSNIKLTAAILKEHNYNYINTDSNTGKNIINSNKSNYTYSSSAFENTNSSNIAISNYYSKSGASKRFAEKFKKGVITAKKKLRMTYLIGKDFYNSKVVNDIIFNEKSSIVAAFKDYLIFDDNSEFLKRLYKKSELRDRLHKIFAYYNDFSKIFPNYIILSEAKYIYKNIQRKQRMIDNQQIQEIKSKKKSTTKKKNDEDLSSEVFNTKIIDSIMNLSISHMILNETQDFDLKNYNSIVGGIGFGNANGNKTKTSKLYNLENSFEELIDVIDGKKTIEPRIEKDRNKEKVYTTKSSTVIPVSTRGAPKDKKVFKLVPGKNINLAISTKKYSDASSNNSHNSQANIGSINADTERNSISISQMNNKSHTKHTSDVISSKFSNSLGMKTIYGEIKDGGGAGSKLKSGLKLSLSKLDSKSNNNSVLKSSKINENKLASSSVKNSKARNDFYSSNPASLNNIANQAQTKTFNEQKDEEKNPIYSKSKIFKSNFMKEKDKMMMSTTTKSKLPGSLKGSVGFISNTNTGIEINGERQSYNTIDYDNNMNQPNFKNQGNIEIENKNEIKNEKIQNNIIYIINQSQSSNVNVYNISNAPQKVEGMLSTNSHFKSKSASNKNELMNHLTQINKSELVSANPNNISKNTHIHNNEIKKTISPMITSKYKINSNKLLDSDALISNKEFSGIKTMKIKINADKVIKNLKEKNTISSSISNFPSNINSHSNSHNMQNVDNYKTKTIDYTSSYNNNQIQNSHNFYDVSKNSNEQYSINKRNSKVISTMAENMLMMPNKTSYGGGSIGVGLGLGGAPGIKKDEYNISKLSGNKNKEKDDMYKTSKVKFKMSTIDNKETKKYSDYGSNIISGNIKSPQQPQGYLYKKPIYHQSKNSISSTSNKKGESIINSLGMTGQGIAQPNNYYEGISSSINHQKTNSASIKTQNHNFNFH